MNAPIALELQRGDHPGGLNQEALTEQELIRELMRLRRRVAAYRAIVGRLILEHTAETAMLQ